MDIIEAIKIIVDILHKEPNLHLIDCAVTPMPDFISLIIKKPPKETKEVTREDKSFL